MLEWTDSLSSRLFNYTSSYYTEDGFRLSCGFSPNPLFRLQKAREFNTLKLYETLILTFLVATATNSSILAVAIHSLNGRNDENHHYTIIVKELRMVKICIFMSEMFQVYSGRSILRCVKVRTWCGPSPSLYWTHRAFELYQ